MVVGRGPPLPRVLDSMVSVVTRAEKCLYEFDGFRVDPVRRRLLKDGEPVSITPKAFSILLILIESRGEVVEKEDIIQKVWPDTFVTEANLTQNISSLRKALGERANDARYIVTLPGRGYSFVADIIELPRDPTGEISLSLIPTPPAPLPLPEPPEEGPAAAFPPQIPARPALPAKYRAVDPLETVQILMPHGIDDSRHEGSAPDLAKKKRVFWLWTAGMAALILLLVTLILL